MCMPVAGACWCCGFFFIFLLLLFFFACSVLCTFNFWAFYARSAERSRPTKRETNASIQAKMCGTSNPNKQINGKKNIYKYMKNKNTYISRFHLSNRVIAASISFIFIAKQLSCNYILNWFFVMHFCAVKVLNLIQGDWFLLLHRQVICICLINKNEIFNV